MNVLREILRWARRFVASLPPAPRNPAPERLPAADRLTWSAWPGSYDVALRDLRRESLAGKEFPSANFFGAILIGIDARGANLERANLVAVDASRSCFRETRLDSANLLGADLSDADFSGADLRAANLSWATLRGADLRGALLEGTFLGSAVYDERTRWPDGVDPRARGAVKWGPGEITPAAAPGGRGDEPAPE